MKINKNYLVDTKEGPVYGVPCGNPNYTVFKGVPYAKPPVGDLRWRDPQPPEKRDEILDCSRWPNIPPQPLYKVSSNGDKGEAFSKDLGKDNFNCMNQFEVSEDCLYMNIWSPKLSPDAKLPVLMWIHGGRYAIGFSFSSDIDGEAYCRNDVVVVSVEPRQGVFGYFGHPDLTKESPINSSGNYGVLDLVQALKWLHENIAAFGGDPDNITISGQSSGGNLTMALMCSPLSKGLMKRAIVMSTGMMLDHDKHYSIAEEEQIGKKVCDILDKSIDDLRAMPTFEVQKAILDSANTFGILEFMPNIDGVVFLEQVYDSMAAGRHHDIDIIASSVSGDNVIGTYKPYTVENFLNLAEDLAEEEADKLVELFDADKPEKMAFAYMKMREVFPKMQPIAWALAELESGNKPFYVYYFDRRMPIDNRGAYHSCDIMYLFGTLDRNWRSKEHGFTGKDYELSRMMNDYCSNFMKTGNPNSPELPRWETFSKESMDYMYFGEKDPVLRTIPEDDIAKKLGDIWVRHSRKKAGV